MNIERQTLSSLTAIAVAGFLSAPNASAQSLVVTNGQIVAANGLQVPNMPTGVVYGGSGTFDNPIIDENGNVLFRFRMQDPGGVAIPPLAVTNDRGYAHGQDMATLSMVIRNGQASPNIPGTTLNLGTTTPTGSGITGSPRLSPNGRIFFGSAIAGAGLTTANDTAIFAGTIGAEQVVVREGDFAPSGGATLNNTFSGLGQQGNGLNRNNRYVFRSTLTGGDVSGTTNNEAVLTGPLGGAMDWVVRKGDAGPSGTIISSVPGFLNQINDSGQVLHDVSLSLTLGTTPATAANDKALYVYTPGSGNTLVAREGQAAPGTLGATFNVTGDFWNINVPPNAFTQNGEFMMHAELLNGDVTAGVNDRAIYLGSTSGLTMAVRRGDAAPGTDGFIDTWNYSNSGRTTSGRIAIASSIIGGTTTSTNNSGIWTGTPGNLQLVVREGDILPGTVATEMSGASGTFGSLPMIMSDSGQVLFQTDLINGDVIPGVNSGALMVWDPTNGLAVVARKGEQVEVSAGVFKTISTYGTIQFNNGDNSPLCFAANGQLALSLFFTDGTSAITKVGIVVLPGGPYCSGDGTAAACPCGNNGIAGNGCANSVNPNGGRLIASGQASIAADSLVLSGSGMPNSSALYIQGTVQQSGGMGVAFGDGLRCAGGSVIRMKTVFNVSGASQYPEVGDPSVSVRGLVTVPGQRVYQTWYRNAAAFCNAETFNLTNGWQITWTP